MRVKSEMSKNIEMEKRVKEKKKTKQKRKKWNKPFRNLKKKFFFSKLHEHASKKKLSNLKKT